MQESRLSTRPLFIFSSAFFVSGIISSRLSSSFVIISGLVTLISAIFCILPFINKKLRKILFPAILGISLASILIFFTINAEKQDAAKLIGTSADCEMQITSVEGTTPNFGSYHAEVISQGEGEGIKLFLTLSDGSLKAGDKLKSHVTFENLTGEESERLVTERIFLKCTADNVTFTGKSDKFSLSEVFGRINSRLSARLKLNGGGPVSIAVLLGNRDGLDLSIRRDFSRLGISHLLAVSGLHLSILVALVDKLLVRLSISKRKICLVRFPVILLYMGITGFSASVMRAGIMHLIRSTGDLLDRKSDSLTSLGIALLTITVIDPYSFYDVGLMMSAVSTFGCITFGMMRGQRGNVGHRNVLKRFLHTSTETALLTVWICVLCLPVTSAYFGTVSLISPITNIIYIPAVTLLLYLSLFHLLFCRIPFISSVSGALLTFTEDFITSSASKISHLPNITVFVSGAVIFVTSVVLFISLAAVPLVSKNNKTVFKLTSAASAAVIICMITVTSVHQMRTSDVLYVTGGKNDGFIIRDGGNFTVIDVSDGSKKSAYKIYSCASDENASEIDTLILSHLHSKHVSSVDEFTSRMIVRRVLLPLDESDKDTDAFEKLTEMLKAKNVRIETYKRAGGEVFKDGDVELNFHSYVKLSRSTHPVVTFDFTLDGKHYAYGGGSRTESRDFIESAPLCDAVFIGAHHPKTKDYTLPQIKYAVVSHGEDTSEIRDALRSSKTAVYLEDGEVFWVSDRLK